MDGEYINKWGRHRSVCFSYGLLSFFFCRIPCRAGMCSTPIHVTSSQLIASEIFPVPVIKGLLYPGAIVNGLVNNRTVARWDDLLSIYNLTSVKEASAVTDLQCLEVLFLLSSSSLWNINLAWALISTWGKTHESMWYFFFLTRLIKSNHFPTFPQQYQGILWFTNYF